MMNYYDELVTHSSCVDFLVLKKVNSPYEKKVVKNGGKVFFLPKVDSYISRKKMRFLDEIMKQRYAAPIKYSLKTRAKRKVKKIIKKMLRVIGGGAESNTEYGLLLVFRV